MSQMQVRKVLQRYHAGKIDKIEAMDELEIDSVHEFRALVAANPELAPPPAPSHTQIHHESPELVSFLKHEQQS